MSRRRGPEGRGIARPGDRRATRARCPRRPYPRSHGKHAHTYTTATERLHSDLEDHRPAWQSNCVPIPVRMAAGALQRALNPASDRDLNLVAKVRLRGRSGRWLTLHASLTEPAPGRPSETVIAPSEPEEVAQLNVNSYGLTPREEEIVKLVARGRSTREISGTLFNSEHTVHNRRELVQRLLVRDLLPGAPGG